ncbi:DUF4398 domain-containing protein [Rhodocaloribacter litoris]|uniref:DUF4398 domain-containing protein n=1 Tax=Rhodocaloribacter litoris TaxID=2558931 RepID=UPI00141D9F9A|nr:DUF4398 domain-containing protein [Rhodocaloribacter litoris]QXD15281.1 DUF4398 domain-containing protein [Rhodocaloribacter litoris]
MKTNRFQALAGLFLLAVVLTGCAQVPQQQLDTAQAALQAAAEAEANLYVADLYQALQDSLAAAQTEIETQKSRFALTRDYSRAERLLQFVTQTAAEAQAATQKEAMRAEAERLIAEARQALTQVQDLLAKAPRGKEGTMALVSIQTDRNNASQTLDQATTALENGKILEARDLAATALEKANLLIQELNTAIAKQAGTRS